MRNDRTVLMAAGLALLASLLGTVGCAKSVGNAPSSPAAQSDASLVAAGKSVFATNGCIRCHSIGGQGGRMGPDLSREGAAPGHTVQWIVEHVKNPRTHNPRSRMPAFQGRINDKEVLALGAYLASLK